MRPVFPFTALVGQEQMKRALALNAINPHLGGVLIRGEKGTAKSTAVRALASLLPEIDVVVGCPYSCDPSADDLCEQCRNTKAAGRLRTARRAVPIVNLPVGATEDRLTGTIDIEAAIGKGERQFAPGLLAAANRGILYVDEVNLLNDHLVDVLLDAAAMGVNYVEREGISVTHPSRFILVGTMNPEEGDLRPQLLDRFALAVEVRGDLRPAERAEVVRRRIAFEFDPVAFRRHWAEQEEAERRRIARARNLLPRVVLDDHLLDLIAHLCADLNVDGLRADIVMYKAAVTLAAYAGRRRVDEQDVRDAAELALVHRRRRQPFESPGLPLEEIERSMEAHRDANQRAGQGRPPHRSADDEPSPSGDGDGGPSGDGGAERTFKAGAPYRVRPLEPPVARAQAPRSAGRRRLASSRDSRGHYVGAIAPTAEVRDLALDATIRAAAPRQIRRRTVEPGGPVIKIRPPDVRVKTRQTRAASLVLFAVDASGSMAARSRMAAAKEAVLSLLLDAYQKRDRVGMVAFRGARADLVLPPTTSVDLAERSLQHLPTGGRTPLAHALQLCLGTIERHRRDHPGDVPLLVLVSDVRPNVPTEPGDVRLDMLRHAARLRAARVPAVVVDTESGPIGLGLGAELANALGGLHVPIAQLRADDLVSAVRSTVGRV